VPVAHETNQFGEVALAYAPDSEAGLLEQALVPLRDVFGLLKEHRLAVPQEVSHWFISPQPMKRSYIGCSNWAK
jgi:hypothetical protein